MKNTFTRKVKKMNLKKENESPQEIVLTKSPEEEKEDQKKSKGNK